MTFDPASRILGAAEDGADIGPADEAEDGATGAANAATAAAGIADSGTADAAAIAAPTSQDDLPMRVREAFASAGIALGEACRAPIVLMVSGGSDSTALACAMARLVPADKLHILHVNHMLRGEAAYADQAFVQGLAEGLHIAFTIRELDIAAIAAAQKANVEATGRQERYRAAEALCDELCDALGVSRDDGLILTAHTRDDRIETFFMRACVGGGAGSLSSIPMRRGRVFRPLLGIGRQELRDWLLALGMSWREDATNSLSDHDRTYIRNEVLPLLRVRYPALDANLSRTMDLLASEDAYMQERALSLLSSANEAARARAKRDGARGAAVCCAGGGEAAGCRAMALDAAQISQAPIALARRAVREALRCVSAPGARFDQKHIDAVLRGVSRDGFATDLPGGVTVVNKSQTLVFRGAGEPIASQMPALKPQWLGVPGSIKLPGGLRLVAARVENKKSRAPSSLDEGGAGVNIGLGLDPRELDPARQALVCVESRRLWVAPARQGERMVPLGFAHGSKKLSDVFVDAKVPREQRQLTAVVRTDEPSNGGEVVWVCGVCVDERHKFVASTEHAVLLTLELRREQEREEPKQ